MLALEATEHQRQRIKVLQEIGLLEVSFSLKLLETYNTHIIVIIEKGLGALKYVYVSLGEPCPEPCCQARLAREIVFESGEGGAQGS